MFRLIDTPPAPGAWNMALDEALMSSVRDGGAPVLRFYRWAPACLSLGRNQPAAGLFDPEEIARLGIDVVRRPTGGRAVLHARELTYSVIVPEARLGGLRQSYLTINNALALGLRQLGVSVGVQGEGGRGRPPAPSNIDPCFHDPVAGEIVIGGRKLVGSAQVREDGVMLQHGSLLLHDDQVLLSRLRRRDSQTAAGAAALADHLDPLPDWTELIAALTAGWRDRISPGLVPSEPTPAEREHARQLLQKHTDLEWIWRR